MSGPHLPRGPPRHLLGETSELNISSHYAFSWILEPLRLSPGCRVASHI